MITKLEVLTENQLKDIMSIWLDTNKTAHSFIVNSYWEDNIDFVKEALPESDVYTSVDNNGNISGFLGIQDGYIAGLFIKSTHQRKGLGKELITQAKRDYPELILSVYEKNEQAIKFYKKEGFTVINQQMDEMTNESEFEMKWKN